MHQMKPKTCKSCGNKFEPQRPLQYLCSPKCAAEYSRKLSAKKEKQDWAVKKAEMKEKLMSKADHLKLLQIVFNTFIRLRDINEFCISCETKNPLIKYDAGHFYHSNYSYLRFNEDNVHKQCSKNCNTSKSGNLAEYRPRLIEKIGQERFDKLEADRHLKLEISIDEIQQKILYYKDKIKQLKKFPPLPKETENNPF